MSLINMKAMAGGYQAYRPKARSPLVMWEGVKTQCRVIHALFLRELITRYGRHNIGFLWLFVEPMILTLGIAGLVSVMGGVSPGGVPAVVFVFLGYSCLLLWRNVPGRCISALAPNSALMYHRHVRPFDIYISRIGLELIGASMSFTILSIFFINFGLIAPPKDYLTTLIGWGLLGWFAAAFGIFMGALSEEIDLIEKLWHPCMYLLIPISGSFFMVEQLPPTLKSIALYMPSVNCIELVREGYLGHAWRWHYDVGYVIAVNAALTALGLAKVRYISRHLNLD